MVMSQGTYTFLTCFAGFWLIWGLIVLLCCFCSFLRRRLKRRQEERLREQNLPPHLSVPPRPWSYPRQAESDMSKPPCYEEAVLMAEPPPPYSEVLTDTRGLYRKIVTPFLSRRDSAEKQEQPPPSYKPLFLDRGYTSALHLPSAPRPAAPCPALCLQADRSRRVFPSWTDSELSSREPLEHGAWRLPVSIPLFGRTTAV
ncbi:proline-rich protein 7 [Fukomys damarensis]|uniref:proline-rich protein 7 n=1 Tax=Fukomys damarensis TaxID=885580 RepID=UPI00053FD323|nr:proline-rich protein 7 [Fukomys damarensis]